MTQCSAFDNAVKNKGWSNSKLASESNISEQRVNEILAGTSKPSEGEFNSLRNALGLSGSFDHVSRA